MGISEASVLTAHPKHKKLNFKRLLWKLSFALAVPLSRKLWPQTYTHGPFPHLIWVSAQMSPHSGSPPDHPTCSSTDNSKQAPSFLILLLLPHSPSHYRCIGLFSSLPSPPMQAPRRRNSGFSLLYPNQLSPRS